MAAELPKLLRMPSRPMRRATPPQPPGPQEAPRGRGGRRQETPPYDAVRQETPQYDAVRQETPPYDSMILAGGAARRLGGSDKALLEVGGRPMLQIVLDAVRSAARVIVVGPQRPGIRGVTWCREHPPGGGPVAALAAALPNTSSPYLCLLATDLPFVTAQVIDRLVAAAQGRDGAVLVDEEGRDQPLCGVYARAAVVRRLGERPQAGRAMSSVLAGLDLARLPDEHGSAFDCDTWNDLDRARRREPDGGEAERAAR
jgi:molybdopterin-guanine dinucleotide biosynthesis protein A